MAYFKSKTENEYTTEEDWTWYMHRYPALDKELRVLRLCNTGFLHLTSSSAFSRPVSATGRQRPSATSAYNAFATVLEEEHDELSEEAFLADMNEEEFEEWIAAQERGDRAKIATLRRLLIIKKLGINTVSSGGDSGHAFIM